MSRRIGAAIVAAGLVAFSAVAQAEETSLIFAPGDPAGTRIEREFIEPWTARINAAGAGVLKIDKRDGTAIVNKNNAYDRVMNDVVQMGFILFSYVAGKIDAGNVAGLPFVDKAADGSVALWRLYASGELNAQFNEAIPLVLFSVSQSQLHMAKPLSDPLDWHGTKLIAPTKVLADIVQLFGGSPLSLGSADVYQAIQRGTASGAVTSWPAFDTYKLQEVTTWHVDQPLGTAAGMIFMARAKYNALPAAARKVLDENSGEASSREFGAWWDRENARGRDAVAALPGQKVVILSPADRARWEKMVQPAVDQWAKSVPNGAEIVARYETLLAQVEAGKPQ